jgi:phosphohistidine phosphatase
LKKHPISPEIILVSSSKRTRQTVKGISEFIPDPEFKNELYLADKNALISELSRVGKVNSILIVGHNEGLSDLVSHLVNTSIQLPTCGYVKLETTLDNASLLSAGVASLVWEFYPEVS